MKSERASRWSERVCSARKGNSNQETSGAGGKEKLVDICGIINSSLNLLKNKMENKKIASEIAVGIILLVAIAVGGVFWLQGKNSSKQQTENSNQQTAISKQETKKPAEPQKEDGVACAMDAKQCADGSYVARVAPTCEFAPCPEIKKDNAAIVDSAKEFILSKPDLLIREGTKVERWDVALKNVDPKWIISHEPVIENNQSSQIGKTVSWFFVLNCEEDLNSKDSPKWFDKSGHQCLGGFNLTVLIKKEKEALLSSYN